MRLYKTQYEWSIDRELLSLSARSYCYQTEEKLSPEHVDIIVSLRIN